jgi:hypothetical protein
VTASPSGVNGLQTRQRVGKKGNVTERADGLLLSEKKLLFCPQFDTQKKIFLFAGPKSSSACLFDNSCTQTKTSMEHWKNDTDRGTLTYWRQNFPTVTVCTTNLTWIEKD